MRVSQLFFHTTKEAPHDADILSHKLLERAGYVRKLSKGLYCYTPLLWRVLRKLMQIMREEMESAGAQELCLPLLQPKELWEQSERWDDFKMAGLLYTLEDREGHEFCLSPTHEEAITQIVTHWITSYRQLPLNLFQMGPKFRDEIRPRFGLMRAKEFLMKDNYSFSPTPEVMEEQYQKMRRAYTRIFERLDLDFVIVEAHGGKIGSGKSEEFQIKAAIGEDQIMVSDSYAANIEQAVAIPPPFSYELEEQPLQKVPTPQKKTVEELTAFTKLPPQKVVKTVVYKLTFADRKEFIAVGIRGDRQLNEVKIVTHCGAYEIAPATEEEFLGFNAPAGFVGPKGLSIPFMADLTVKPMKNCLVGANEKDWHFTNFNFGRDCAMPEFADFLLAQEGDLCPHTSSPYKKQHGIEVGHIFNLGTKYAEKLKACFQDEHGVTQPFWMGCYGIGIGRTAQATIEQKHDEKGIIWPLAIAPYKFFITPVNSNDAQLKEAAEALYHELQLLKLEPLYDDRDERIGVKLKDSDLLGLPFKVIFGRAFREEGKIEVESRAGEKQILTREEFLAFAKTIQDKS